MKKIYPAGFDVFRKDTAEDFSMAVGLIQGCVGTVIEAGPKMRRKNP